MNPKKRDTPFRGVGPEMLSPAGTANYENDWLRCQCRIPGGKRTTVYATIREDVPDVAWGERQSGTILAPGVRFSRHRERIRLDRESAASRDLNRLLDGPGPEARL